MKAWDVQSIPGSTGGRGPRGRWLLIGSLLLLAVQSATAQVQSVAIDVPAVQASGNLLVDGSFVPPLSDETGTLSLEGPAGPGSGIVAGRTSHQSYGPTWIVPGDYQPIYSADAGTLGTTHPSNERAPIGPPALLDGSQPLDIDVPTVVVTFDLTLNGGAFGTIFNGLAIFSLRHVETGDQFTVGESDDLPFGVRVVPGTYDLIYHYDQGAFFPKNSNAVIGAALDLSSSQTVSIDVPMTRHTLTVDLNGGPFPTTLTDHGNLALESPDGNDRVDFGSTTQSPLPDLYMVEGTYRLVFELVNGGSTVPLNTRAIVDDAVAVVRTQPCCASSSSYSNVVTSSVTFDATLDGASFPTSLTAYGDLSVVDENGDETLIGKTTLLSYTRTLIDGTYDIHYQWRNGGIDVPRNANARVLSDQLLTGTLNLVFDVPTVSVDLQPRLDGQTFPTSLTAYGDLELEGSTPGDRFPIGLTTASTLPVRLIPGAYDVIYSVVNGAGIVPPNTDARFVEGLVLDTDQAVVADMTTTTIEVQATLNAQPFPTGTGDVADLFLRSTTLGEAFLLQTDWTTPVTLPIIDGAYDVEYEWQAGNAIPKNGSQRLETVVVPEPGTTPGLVSGAVLLAAISRRRIRT